MRPLLEKYNVHAYLAGHDHISEHLVYNDVNYYVCGAGSMTDKLSSKSSSVASLVWSGTEYR